MRPNLIRNTSLVAIMISCFAFAIASDTLTLQPHPPHDVTTSQAEPNAQLERDQAWFAWNQFLALTWKATYNPPANHQRGMPDENWNHGSLSSNNMGYHYVFETYAHRTELRPNHRLERSFDSIPSYSFKQMPTAGSGNPSFTLLNNLDEDNEIGSCDVYLGGTSSTLMLYQAKVNRVMYDYVKQYWPNQYEQVQQFRRLYEDELYTTWILQHGSYPRINFNLQYPNGYGEPYSVLRLPAGRLNTDDEGV